MNFSGVLDNIVALVVIILVLSLIVQSVQQALKKLFKIKSRQIQESMLDLFETVLGKAGTPERATSPILDLLPFRKTSIDQADASVQALFKSVNEEFKKLGRVSQSGKLMLDSIAKDDLLKIFRKINPEQLLGGTAFGQDLQQACDAIKAAENTLNAIHAELLTGSASADFAALRDRLTPIVNDLSGIVDDKGRIDSKLLIEDILNLREISVTEIFERIGKVQDGLQRQIQAATGQTRTDLELVAKQLGDLNSALSTLRQRADAALVSLRTRIAEVERWFDTVMQSFEERYTRGMKTWGLVISFIIVMLMNANVFDIYSKISSNEQARTKILQMADTVDQKARDMQNAPAAQTGTGVDDLKKSVNDVKANVDTFSGLQFQPLTRAAVERAWSRNTALQNLKILLGWILMTMLLSAGAPFWEDTLESLFGVKNLLRQKGSIKNVEEGSGKGNPKT